MSYDLLIHQYLDSGLDDVRQEALFAEIARNPEVRSEFNSQLKLQNIAKMDLNSISPPADITSNIFQKLEFSVPSTVEKVGFWNRVNIAIISVLLGLALGSGLFYSFSGSGSNPAVEDKNPNFTANNFEDSNNSFNSNELPVRKIDEISNGKIEKGLKTVNQQKLQNSNQNLFTKKNNQNRNTSTNLRSSKNIASNPVSNSIPSEQKTLQDYLNKRTYKPNFITSEDSKKSDNDKITKFLSFSENKISQSSLDGYSKIDSENNLINTNGNTPRILAQSVALDENIVSQKEYSSSNPLNIGPDNTTWSIGIRQINQINIEPTVNNENSAFLNRSLFINYKLSSNIVLVGEIGREKFVQEYEQSIAGTDVQTTQNPILTWYGLGAKFRADEIFGQHFVTPYIQTLFAANSIGPILRPTIGLDFRLNEYFTVTSSYDRPILFYSVYGENLNSSKHGFTVGFNLNF
jgi:hypothetical protein